MGNSTVREDNKSCVLLYQTRQTNTISFTKVKVTSVLLWYTCH